jgi:magnesium transporter
MANFAQNPTMSTDVRQPMLRERFEALAREDDPSRLADYLNDQNISDVAELIESDEEGAVKAMACLEIQRAAGVFKILDLSVQKHVIQHLPPQKTAELLNELPSDDRTAFLEELPNEVVRELIRLLNPEERRITLAQLGYPEESVGRLMTNDYLAVEEDWSVHEVLEHIRSHGQDIENLDVIYVVNSQGRLVDDVRIREFLLSPPERMVHELVDGRYIALHVNDDQESANQVFKMNNRVALPVIDDRKVMLGIVTIDDVLWVANEEFSEDMQKMGGTEALDEPYLDIPILKLFKKRVVWLVVLLLGEMLTATVMGYYEAEIQRAVILALFIPLIISSGGNSGSQASTLIIQAMAVGEVRLRDWWQVMRREILSGLLLGSVLGVIGFARVAVWSQFFPDMYGPHYIQVGLVVGLSLLGVVLQGTLTGSMFPFLLKRMGADPAVSSAPFVATIIDVTGLIIYFSFAFLLLKGLML